MRAAKLSNARRRCTTARFPSSWRARQEQFQEQFQHGKSVMDRDTTELTDVAAVDAAMMARCIELSKTGGQAGEFPFACVIAKDGKVVVETTNRVARDGDVTRHAEIVAVGMAQKALG